MVDAISSSLARLSAPQSLTSASAAAPTASAGAVQGGDFASMLQQLASNAVDTMKAGESMATAGIKGTASIQDVAQAVMAAEQTLQASIVVRDKVVSAYLELSRMAI